MFIAGLRKLDRVRGDGWLDCPNCHEHAAQDVVDEMRFAALVFYRFTPVGRHRILRCRRCGFRRAATDEEMSHLRTAGHRIGRAWLAPVGMTPFAVGLIVAVAIILHSSQSASAGTSYKTVRADPVAPVSMSIPAGFSTDTTQAGTFAAASGPFAIRLHRYVVDQQPAAILNDHLADDIDTFHSTGFPSTPPNATETKIAGSTALHVTIKYEQFGGEALLDMYAFNHGGVAYMLSFQVTGAGGQTQIDDIAPKVIDSLTFTSSETAAPTPSETPTPTVSPSGSSSSSSSST